MKRVFKYTLEMIDEQAIAMPKGAFPMTVQTQNDKPQVWMFVDDSQPPERRKFRIVGTGHPADDVQYGQYVGTFQMQGGSLVFHLFQQL